MSECMGFQTYIDARKPQPTRRKRCAAPLKQEERDMLELVVIREGLLKNLFSMSFSSRKSGRRKHKTNEMFLWSEIKKRGIWTQLTKHNTEKTVGMWMFVRWWWSLPACYGTYNVSNGLRMSNHFSSSYSSSCTCLNAHTTNETKHTDI